MLYTSLLFPELFETGEKNTTNGTSTTNTRTYNKCTCSPYSTTDADDNLIWNIPVPGCSDKDVSVELDGNFLKIEAKSSYNDFDFNTSLSYKIPDGSDKSSISAAVADGLLSIKISKHLEKIKVKKLL